MTPLLARLRQADPGLLRTIEAGKTVMTVVVTLAIVHRMDLESRLLGSMGAPFFLQCTSTGSMRRRRWTMLVVAAATIVCTAASAALWHHRFVQHAWLVLVSFAVFFCRRFLPDRGMFTVFVFIMTLLAAAIPAGGRSRGDMRLRC